MNEPHGQHVGDGNDPGRPFDELMDSGLLWLINASVLHPRGLALALHVDNETGKASGWSLRYAGDGEAYRYAVPCELDDPSKAADIDDLFRRAEETLQAAKVAES